MPSPTPVPAFPFNSTRTGVLFTILVSAACALTGGLVTAYVTARLAHRNAARDGDADRRRAVCERLRAAVLAIETALDDASVARQNAVRAACAAWRDVAYVELGGAGTERLQDRATEFVFGIESLESQRGPVSPHDETARSLFDDMNAAIYAHARGWRVPRRLRGRPGLLGTRRKRPSSVPVGDHAVLLNPQEPG